MKKRLLLSLLLLLPIFSIAQQTTDRLYTPGGGLNSNANSDGIGINETTPDAALHINQSDDLGTALHIDVQNALLPGSGNYTEPAYALRINSFSDGIPGPPTELVTIAAKDGATRIGYFGTGSEKLMVGSAFGIYQNSTNKINLKYDSSQPELSWTTSSSKNFRFKNSTTGAIPISLSPDGKVGINTDHFVGNYSLYIEGTSVAEEMVVLLKDDWGDYVFKDDYLLLPLNDLERFISEKGHLPEMPTAAEVKDEGVKTGETLRLLTVKIEELTLYILQQQKEIEALNEKLDK